MKKEIVFTIIIGLILGLIITYGIYLSRHSFQPQTQIIENSSPTPTSSMGSTLVVHNPQDEMVVTQKDLTVTGTTWPRAFVVVLFGEEEHITSADDSGNFSVNANLAAGSNVITVKALDENGQETSLERVIILADTAPFSDDFVASASASVSANKK